MLRLRTNGLYGRKTFMPPPRFTAGLLLFSERSDGDVINLRSCVNFRLLSQQRNYGTFWLLLDKVFGFSGSRVTKSFSQINENFLATEVIEIKKEQMFILSHYSF